MNKSIVMQLVKKDLRIMGIWMLLWWLLGVASVLLAIFGGSTFAIPAVILYVTAMGGAGIHAIMQTIIEERTERSREFIMSLPLTVRDYTSAKLVFNLFMFGSVWITMGIAGFVIFIGGEVPLGAIPFVVVIMVSILFAYTIILATSLISERQGVAIFAIVGANIGTQVFLWSIADLYGIRSVIGGNTPVWNLTILTVLGFLVLCIASLIAVTYFLQSRKSAFV